jgi:hypothetical protein
MSKKNFTKADGAIDKMFARINSESAPVQENKDVLVLDVSNIPNNTQRSNNIDITNNADYINNKNNLEHDNVLHKTYDTQYDNRSQNTDSTNETNISKITNKSKHYDKRGPRGERFALLLDKHLKDDLTQLSKATGSKSVNDFIVTVLLKYVEKEENQAKLEQYKKLLQS